MANKLISDLAADAAPNLSDLFESLRDPAGSPSSRKVLLSDLIKYGLGAAIGFDFVGTDETQASNTAYGDLATVGPTVTLTLSGTKALVVLACNPYRAGAGNSGFMAVDISGANTIAAGDSSRFLQTASTGSNIPVACAAMFTFTGLAAGSTTFKAKYHNDGGSTWHFFNRGMLVIALP